MWKLEDEVGGIRGKKRPSLLSGRNCQGRSFPKELTRLEGKLKFQATNDPTNWQSVAESCRADSPGLGGMVL